MWSTRSWRDRWAVPLHRVARLVIVPARNVESEQSPSDAQEVLMAWIDPSLLSGFSGHIKMETLMSVGSACLTCYFWLVKMRRESAGLKLYQPAAFRADRLQCSRVPGKEKATWYGDLFLANPST